MVIVNDITTIYVPNAFTPNENGINETWGPKGTNLNPDKFHIWVYNRWGELIWDTDNLNQTWNGTYHNQGEPVQQGVYAWKIMCKNYDGTTSYYDGHVTIVK
jgi:gliding motility-associated-like protein